MSSFYRILCSQDTVQIFQSIILIGPAMNMAMWFRIGLTGMAILLLGAIPAIGWVLYVYGPCYLETRRLEREWGRLEHEAGLSYLYAGEHPVWTYRKSGLEYALREIAKPLRTINQDDPRPAVQDERVKCKARFHKARKIACYVLGEELPGLGHYLKDR